MEIYQTHVNQLSGTDYREVVHKARIVYMTIAGHSRRRPYIRAVYFKKQKIFLETFWSHLNDKTKLDRTRRLKLLPCAIDLMRFSHAEPGFKVDEKNTRVIFYRFYGVTAQKIYFAVHIRFDSQRNERWFMSVFPIHNHE